MKVAPLMFVTGEIALFSDAFSILPRQQKKLISKACASASGSSLLKWNLNKYDLSSLSTSSHRSSLPQLYSQNHQQRQEWIQEDFDYNNDINPVDEGAYLGEYQQGYFLDEEEMPRNDMGSSRGGVLGQPPTLGQLRDWTEEYVDTVDLAGGMTRMSQGVQQFLDEEYVHCSPEIGPLCKRDYIQLMDYYCTHGMDLGTAAPDLKAVYSGWHVDLQDPWRVWAVVRYTGTHTGLLTDPDSSLTLSPDSKSNHRFMTGPELQSFRWTPYKTLIWHTAGFAADEFTGSNQGVGGLKGLMVSMGLPKLFVKATGGFREVEKWISQFGENPRISHYTGSLEEIKPRTKSPNKDLPPWWINSNRGP